MKHRSKQNFFQYLQEILPDLKKMAHEEANGVLHHLVNYTILSLQGIATINIQQVVSFFYQISEDTGGTAMTLAEQLQETGFKKGMQQGMHLGEEKLRRVVKNLIDKKHKISEMVELTGLSEIEIRSLLN